MENKKSKKKTIQFVLIGVMLVLIAAAFVMSGLIGKNKEHIWTYDDYITEGDKMLDKGDKAQAYENYKKAYNMETDADKAKSMYKIFTVTESAGEKLLMAYYFLDNTSEDDEAYKDSRSDVMLYIAEYNDYEGGSEGCIYMGSYPQRKITDEEIVNYLKRNSAKFDNAGIADIYGKKYIKLDTEDGEQFFTVDKIAWKVLLEEDGKKFMVSELVLDCEYFMPEIVDSSWDVSYMREWINTEFRKIAFTDKEYEKLELMYVKNPDNYCYGTSNGEDTEDYITMLSCNDLADEKYGFKDKDTMYDDNRIAKCTEYAAAKGVFADEEMNAKWWTNSNGSMNTAYVFVNTNGVISVGGELCTNKNIGVRPVITIKE